MRRSGRASTRAASAAICPVPFAAGFLGGLALVFATVAAIGREERSR